MIICPCYSQSEPDSDNNVVSVESERGKEQESLLTINSTSTEDSTFSDSGNKSTVWLFVRMFFVLLFVVICIYFVVFLLKRGTKITSSDDPYLKVVSTLVLSPGKYIYIVTLKEKGYIIGVTDNSVNLLGMVEDKELVDAMNLNADKKQETKIKDFDSILKYFHIKKDNTDNTENSVENNVQNLIMNIQEQTKQLNNDGENQ